VDFTICEILSKKNAIAFNIYFSFILKINSVAYEKI